MLTVLPLVKNDTNITFTDSLEHVVRRKRHHIVRCKYNGFATVARHDPLTDEIPK